MSYVDYSVTKGKVCLVWLGTHCFKQSSILMLEKSQELSLVLGGRIVKVCAGPWVLGKAILALRVAITREDRCFCTD